MGRRLLWAEPRVHPALLGQAAALQEVARRAGGDDVVPGRAAAARARHDVIEGQIVRRVRLAAILTAEAVAQEDVEPGESGTARGGNVFLQRDDAGQAHLEARAAHHLPIFGDDVDAIEKYRLDDFLPRPQLERDVRSRTATHIEDQGR